MPLLVVSGHPSSGKTVLANLLSRFFSEKLKDRPEISVQIVSDDLQSTFSREIYRDSSAKEREQRAFLRSEVQKRLTKNCLVICDSLNYIKGFRYELFCIAKSAKTSYCVIHCEAGIEDMKELSERKPEAERYDEAILNGLVLRFERPESKNRWDSPLFSVHTTVFPSLFTNDELQESISDLLPLHEIYKCLFEGKVLKENQSTQSQPLAGTNFLYELDRITQEIVQSLMCSQATAVPGDSISIPGTKTQVDMKKNWSLMDLTRLKRQFLTYTKSQPMEEKEKIAGLFANFINMNQR